MNRPRAATPIQTSQTQDFMKTSSRLLCALITLALPAAAKQPNFPLPNQ